MISIKPRSVPDFLKCSAFFANLGDDDEGVSVPINCCKLDATVTNAAELEDLLRTLRFWGVDGIPCSVVNYSLDNPREVWEPVLNRFAIDLPSVASIMQVLKYQSDHRVCQAVEIEHVGIVSCLLEHSFPSAYIDQNQHSIFAVNIAARKGNLEIMKVLHQHNCPFTMETSIAAALAGSEVCLKYLVETGCPVAHNLTDYAFASGSLECLKYVHETVGCNWTNNLFGVLDSQRRTQSSSEESLVQCLEYALTHGCPHDFTACSVCAMHGFSLLLKCLHEHGCPWGEMVTRFAAVRNHLPCLQYAMDHECPYRDDLVWHAVLNDHVDIVRYLREKGLPWSIESLCTLRYINNETAKKIAVGLLHVYPLGCPRPDDSCLFAAKFGLYDLLVDAHQHGCEWDGQCTKQAVINGYLRCLQYLHENGCPWDASITKDALVKKRYDCLKYAAENGCPMSKDTVKVYHELVHNGTII